MEDVHIKERLAKAVHFHQTVAVKTAAVQFNRFNDDNLKIPAIQVDQGCQFLLLRFFSHDSLLFFFHFLVNSFVILLKLLGVSARLTFTFPSQNRTCAGGC